MPGKINVITIDISKISPNIDSYAKLDFEQQLKFICNHIRTTAAALERKHPKHMNIFVWREHGISDGTSSFVTIAQKNKLKQMLSAIIDDHPSCVIIAGTIKVTKKLEKKHIVKVGFAYSELKKINFSDSIEHFEKEIDKHESAAITATNQFTDEFKPVEIVRNSCLIFHSKNEKTHISRYDKTTPYDETFGHMQKTPLIFRPGSGTSADPIISLTHPFTEEEVTIGIEICREHILGNLKLHLMRTEKTPPLLQVIISDSTHIEPTNLCGKWCVHSDSILIPRLIRTSSEYKNRISHINIGLNNKPELKTLSILNLREYEQYIIFECKILNLLDMYIYHTKPLPNKSKIMDLKIGFIRSAAEHDLRSTIDFLHRNITNYYKQFPTNKARNDFFSSKSKTSHPDHALLQEILNYCAIELLDIFNNQTTSSISNESYSSTITDYLSSTDESNSYSDTEFDDSLTPFLDSILKFKNN